VSIDLATPARFIKGVGPSRAEALEAAGIRSVEDLLSHLPLRYEDRRLRSRIVDLKAGQRASLTATVGVAGLRRTRRMPLFEAVLEDGSGRLRVIWFNQPYLKDSIKRGMRLALYGVVTPERGRPGQLAMLSPQFEILDETDEASTHGHIVPVYERIGPLTNRILRRILSEVARQLPEVLPEILPREVITRLGLVSRLEALRRVHLPADSDSVAELNERRSPAQRRLIIEEFFLFQLGLALRREGLRGARARAAFEVNDRIRAVVKRILPFKLTEAQKRVLREIAADLAASQPMLRLLQGDVGSGKTLVALVTMVFAVEHGYQAAFMVPTEILAEQHYLTFKRLLAGCRYEVVLLTAGRKGSERKRAEEGLASGAAQIVIGTQALIQQQVGFGRLGLVVIDEQHRFGVLQREELMSRGQDTDVLVMTATPIPRTLALTAYGDLDTSIIDELPPGRTPVRTLQRPSSRRREVADLVRGELAAGRQGYVVYPLVEESEKLEDVRAATAMADEWRAALPDVQIELLHGKLPAQDKDEIMRRFVSGTTQLLVATTVIEVGVDVPNASVMVIEHAERFGLAQLHQLRGRVGRGRHASTCVLLSHGRLSEEARSRLKVMRESQDGFVIAERDLEIRGPGDFFGTRQAGLPSLKIGHLLRDRDLLAAARSEAFRYQAALATDPGAEALRRFFADGGWERRFGLSQVA
jgi:ATP-dependent DNA helicase RecG